MSIDIELDRETTPVKEPAKAWRNKWRALQNWTGPCNVCRSREQWMAGDTVITHCRLFPSREVAEQKAVDSINDNTARGLGDILAYLGPIQVPT